MAIYYSVHVTSSPPTNPLSIIVSITFHCAAIKSSKLIPSKNILLSLHFGIVKRIAPTRHYELAGALDQKLFSCLFQLLMYVG